jgi:hypothetical protein
MSGLAAFAATALLMSAVLATLGLARAAFAWPSRAIALVGGAALLPLLLTPGQRALALLGIASALVARPVGLVAGVSAALLLALRDGGDTSLAPLAAAACAAASSAAVSSSLASRWAGGRDPLAAMAGAGALLALVLTWGGGPSLLRWRFPLGDASGLALGDAGLLLGLALLASLAGALIALACLAAGTTGRARRLASKCLLLATGLAVPGVAIALFRGSDQPAALATSAPALAGIVAGTALLALALVVFLAEDRATGDPTTLEQRSEKETRLAAMLAAVAAALAVRDAIVRDVSYVTPVVGAAIALLLLGIAALQPTRFATLRRLALLLASAFLVV